MPFVTCRSHNRCRHRILLLEPLYALHVLSCISCSCAAWNAGTPSGDADSVGATSGDDTGRFGAEALGFAGDVQLASKNPESQKALSGSTPKSSQDTKDNLQASHAQQGAASQSEGAQEGGGTESTSTSRSSNSCTTQEGSKHGLDPYLMIRDSGASIPAAHQLRALSAGHCFCLCLSLHASVPPPPTYCVGHASAMLHRGLLWKEWT